jgi:hypothetical protein
MVLNPTLKGSTKPFGSLCHRLKPGAMTKKVHKARGPGMKVTMMRISPYSNTQKYITDSRLAKFRDASCLG